MRVAFGTDEKSVLAETVLAYLEEQGHEAIVLALPERWPEAGRLVAEAVAGRRADAGVVSCWTGTGVSIAANKVSGVRAALCVDAETARGARKWNDANVLALSIRLTSPEVAREILDAFLAGEPDHEEADAIAMLPS